MFLADTNVLSEVMRPAPSPAVLGWLSRQHKVLVSAVTVFEIEAGIARLSGARRDRLTQWLEGLLAGEAHAVVPVDVAVARTAGRLRQRCEERGRPRPLADLLIVATAQVTGAVVATRNVVDFEGLGVPLLNPFEG